MRSRDTLESRHTTRTAETGSVHALGSGSLHTPPQTRTEIGVQAARDIRPTRRDTERKRTAERGGAKRRSHEGIGRRREWAAQRPIARQVLSARAGADVPCSGCGGEAHGE